MIAAAAEPSRPASRAFELMLLALLATLWGASYALIKIGVATIPPVTLIAGRTLVAGLVLLVVLRARGIGLPRDFATWRQLAVQACLNSVLPFVLIAWGSQYVESSLAAILNSTTPVFAFLIVWGVTRQEPAIARKLFGVAAGLAGIVLVVGTDALAGARDPGGQTLAGQLAIVLATLAYGAAAVYGTRFKHLDSAVPAAGSLLCGAAILVPVSLLLDRPWTLTPSGASLAALLALAIFSTALAFAIYFRLFRTLGAVAATSQAYLRVPVGVAIGAALMGESLSPTAWIGFVCVMVGVVAMTMPPRPSRARRRLPPSSGSPSGRG